AVNLAFDFSVGSRGPGCGLFGGAFALFVGGALPAAGFAGSARAVLRSGGGAALVVGGVEAAALEVDADRIEQLPQCAAAFRTNPERLAGQALEHPQAAPAL